MEEVLVYGITITKTKKKLLGISSYLSILLE